MFSSPHLRNAVVSMIFNVMKDDKFMIELSKSLEDMTKSRPMSRAIRKLGHSVGIVEEIKRDTITPQANHLEIMADLQEIKSLLKTQKQGGDNEYCDCAAHIEDQN